VIGGAELESFDAHLLRGAGGQRIGSADGPRGRRETGLAEGRGGITDVIRGRRAGGAVVADGRPAQRQGVARRAVRRQSVIAAGGIASGPASARAAFRRPPVTVILYGGIYHEASDQFPSVATDADEIDMWSDWGLTGLGEFKKIKTACLVALGTMRRFNLHVGQQLELRGTVYPFNVTLTIVGTIAKGPVPSFLIFRRDYFEEAAGKPGIAHEFWVRVDDSRFVPEVAAAVDNQFANSAAETRSASEAAAVGSILGRYRIFMNLAEFLGVVAVVAIGLVAANTAAMSIRERRSEIAVMRSIGFSSGVILSLLVGESLIVALSGGAIGCGVAFGLFRVFALNADALGPLSRCMFLLLCWRRL